MALAVKIQDAIERSSWIRKMFEEGARLKALHGSDMVYDFRHTLSGCGTKAGTRRRIGARTMDQKVNG